MIEPGKSGHRNGGVARNAARHVSAASAGIHLTWILPSPPERPVRQRTGGPRRRKRWPPRRIRGGFRVNPSPGEL